MSRLTIEKLRGYRDEYITCLETGRYSNFYNNTTNAAFGTDFKNLALCAFDKYNENRTSRERINKQELYCSLFCMGFPLGLIAKTLLNANLGPVRNAVLLYKDVCVLYIANQNVYKSTEQRISEVANEQRGPEGVRAFRENIISYCGFVGGVPLIDKLIFCQDVESLFNSVNNANFTNVFVKLTVRPVYERLGRDWNIGVGRRRGTVRQTSLTTSRVAATPQTTVQAVQSSTPTQPVTVSTNSLSTPEADAVTGSATRQSRQLVRDVPIDITTFGIEIEGSFITDGLDSLKKPASMNFIDYMKKIVDEAQYPAKEYKKDMTLKREGKLSMKPEGRETPTGQVCWSYKYDGSVHGGQENREIVSPILRGENGIKQLKIICSAMRRSGFYSNATAGVHVHLGAAGLSLDTFKNICWNYTGFEPLIDMMFPSDRRWSNAYFAESFSSISNFAQKLDRANSFADLTNYSGIMGGGRYWKVNLQAFNSLGTIEFRQCIGTNDDRLITWFLYYCFYLMEASKRKRLTNFNLKNLQDILPTWAFTYFIDRVRSVSGYDIKYGYDIGSRGSTGTRTNTNTRGGDPMGTPLNVQRGNQKSRRGGWNQRSGNNDIFD